MRANHFTIAALAIAGLMSCSKKAEKEDTELSSITTVINAASELPTCSAETMAQVYWVEETGKLVVCNGSQFVEIKGEKGDTGPQGETGNAGSPANSGVWVFDGDAKPIGVLMNATGLVLFTNGGMARVNLSTGAYNNPIAVVASTGGMIDASVNSEAIMCYFIENDCSGSCYQAKSATGTTVAPLNGAVYRNGNKYFVATGKEDLVPGLNLSMQDETGSCAAAVWAGTLDGYAITKPYTFPEGINFPLKTPLTFGFKTEQ